MLGKGTVELTNRAYILREGIFCYLRVLQLNIGRLWLFCLSLCSQWIVAAYRWKGELRVPTVLPSSDVQWYCPTNGIGWIRHQLRGGDKASQLSTPITVWVSCVYRPDVVHLAEPMLCFPWLVELRWSAGWRSPKQTRSVVRPGEWIHLAEP